MRKFLAAAALIIHYQAAAAVPADILSAGHWGSDGWNERVPTYASGSTLNVIGDGSTTGGTAPGMLFEFSEVAPVTNRSLYANSGPYTLTLTTLNGGHGTESKFRTTVSNQVTILYDDAIRNAGQPGQSHCHTNFGNLSINAYSTYNSLRQNAVKYSKASGGPLNGTAYWFPCVINTNPFGDGKNYVVKPSNSIIVYYADRPSQSIKTHRLPLGLRYVGGYNMDDNDLWLRSIIATANAQPGTPANRYRLCQSNNAPAGNYHVPQNNCSTYYSWRCEKISGGESWQVGFRNPDGSDIFGGECPAGQRLWVQFNGPTCWDGVNFWSPGGYKHVIPKIYDSVLDAADDGSVNGTGMTCPNGWYQIPAFQFQIEFPHNGPDDRANWVLSSGTVSTPGDTFHSDWFGAWDRTTLSNWLSQCIAIGHEGNLIPHECDGSVTSTGEQLKQAGTTTTSTLTAGDMFLLPDQSNGPKTIHVH